jgi:hypothetical protein
MQTALIGGSPFRFGAGLNMQVADQGGSRSFARMVRGMMQAHPVLFVVVPPTGANGIGGAILPTHRCNGRQRAFLRQLKPAVPSPRSLHG